MSRLLSSFEEAATLGAWDVPWNTAGQRVEPRDVQLADSGALFGAVTKRLGVLLPQPLKAWAAYLAAVRGPDGPMSQLPQWESAAGEGGPGVGDVVDLVYGGYVYPGGVVKAVLGESEGREKSFAVQYEEDYAQELFYNASQLRRSMEPRECRLDLMQAKGSVGLDSRALVELCRLGKDAVVLYMPSSAMVGGGKDEELVEQMKAARIAMVDKSQLAVVVIVLDKKTGLPERSEEGAKVRMLVPLEEIVDVILELDMPVRREDFPFFSALTAPGDGAPRRGAAAVATARLARSASTSNRSGFATPVGTPLKPAKTSSQPKRPHPQPSKKEAKDLKIVAKKKKEAEGVRRDIAGSMAAGDVGGPAHSGLLLAPTKDRAVATPDDVQAKTALDVKVVKEGVLALSEVPRILHSLNRLPAMVAALSDLPEQLKEIRKELGSPKEREDTEGTDKDLIGEAIIQVMQHPDWLKAVKAAVRQVLLEELPARGPPSFAAGTPGTPVTPKPNRPSAVRDRRASAEPGLDPSGWLDAEKPLLDALKKYVQGPKGHIVAKIVAKYKYDGLKKFSNASAMNGTASMYSEPVLTVDMIENLLPLLTVFSPDTNRQTLAETLESTLLKLNIGAFHLLYLLRRVARAHTEEKKRVAEENNGEDIGSVTYKPQSAALMAWLFSAVRILIIQRKAPSKWFNALIRHNEGFKSARTLHAQDQGEGDEDSSHSSYLRSQLACYTPKKGSVGLELWLDAYYALFAGLDDLTSVSTINLHTMLEQIGLKMQKSPPDTDSASLTDSKTKKAKKAPKKASVKAASEPATSEPATSEPATSDVGDDIDDEY